MASFGSSVINKSGKKFAPKVTARRRNGAGPASEETSVASSADQTPVGTPQPNAPPVTSDAQPETSDSHTPSAPITAPSQVAPTAEPAALLPTPAATQQPLNSSNNEPEELLERSPKRRRIEAPQAAKVTAQGATTAATGYNTNAEGTVETTTPAPGREPAAVAVNNGITEFTAADVAKVADGRPQNNAQLRKGVTARGRRVAMSKLSDQDIIRDAMGPSTGVTRPSRKPPTTEATPRVVQRTDVEVPAQASSQGGIGAESQSRAPVGPVDQTKGALNARVTRRKAAAASASEEEQLGAETHIEAESSTTESQVLTDEGQSADVDTAGAPAQAPTQDPPAKKPRKPRKDKGVSKKRTAMGSQGESGIVEDDQTPAPKPKRVRKKATPKLTANGAQAATGEDEDNIAASNERQPGYNDHLVFDKEDRENPEKTKINEQSMPMGVLTRDLTMVGTVSNREEALSRIDWDEEKRKRIEERERIALGEEIVNTQAERAAALRQINEAADSVNRTQGPRMRVVNGRMVLDTSSTQVDRRAQALEDEAELQEVEEDDLTTRVTSMSWIKANRKDPRERTTWGPTRADRWTEEQTNAFYDALKMFGTDFFIISKMFPGKTRANVKRKFVKEERADPERIKAALIGESVPMDFELYKQKTGKPEEFFRDPKALEQELAEENERHRAEIQEAQTKHAEMLRQKQLAKQGAEEGDGKKKKRERKKKKGPIGGEEIEVVEMDGDEFDHR